MASPSPVASFYPTQRSKPTVLSGKKKKRGRKGEEGKERASPLFPGCRASSAFCLDVSRLRGGTARGGEERGEGEEREGGGETHGGSSRFRRQSIFPNRSNFLLATMSCRGEEEGKKKMENGSFLSSHPLFSRLRLQGGKKKEEGGEGGEAALTQIRLVSSRFLECALP